MRETLQTIALAAADGLAALQRPPLPEPERLAAAKLIAHRGAHCATATENTMRAFHRARDLGLWGVECDIRWTADEVPVIHHDCDTRRSFDQPLRLADTSFATLRRKLPEIPTLAEVVAEFGGSLHLMLELKAGDAPPPARQRQILQRELAGLEPLRDYHFLALQPMLFDSVAGTDPKALFLVAETNVTHMSNAAMELGIGGITGHFLLLHNGVKQRHEALGQRLGTGFIRSRACLHRELNRGVDWLFTNHAAQLQAALDHSR